MGNFEFFTNNHLFENSSSDRFLSNWAAEADLTQLRQIIGDRHSYVASVAFPYELALAAMAKRLPQKVSINNLALRIHKLVQHLGDSHAMVVDWRKHLPAGYSPVAIGVKGNLGFAYHPQTRRLVDTRHPYVRAIDGMPLHRWLEAAGNITSGPFASRSQRLARSLSLIRFVEYMRRELGLPGSSHVALELTDDAGRSVSTVELPLTDRLDQPDKLLPLANDSKVLPGNVGYLRIYSQKDSALAGRIDEIMRQFQATDALIIDARQCGGGTRENLAALFPYFMRPEDGVYIHNVARLRAARGTPVAELVDRLKVDDKAMDYRLDPKIAVEERQALEAFLADFRPQWQPPAEDFTDWYFGKLRAVPGKPHYDRPVYLLMDWGVGSAGDIFVSTFKGWRGVTLVGMPSNGRSGNSIPFQLGNSGIAVRLSTMASFQKTGEMYDGYGIAPDVTMEAEISDWLGETDTVLDRVLNLATAAARDMRID